MPPKKMTAQPVRARHFAGKPAAPEVEESSASESEPESEEEQKPKPYVKPKPAPLVSTFPKSALKSNLAARQKSEAERKQLEAEFETESEEESEESGSESGSEEESSEEDESSSEEETRPKFQRPVFLKKNQRNHTAPAKTSEELAAEEEKKRQEHANALVKEQIEQRIAEKAKVARDWDDDAVKAGLNEIDTDTDDLETEVEYAAWKLREWERMKREREKYKEQEALLAEKERRRNLTDAEREAEDRQRQEKEEAERGDRGQMEFMQKYHHKGAFFQEELKELGLDKRNLMGVKFQDSANRELLPEYMQIRDMTKLGKKGRTKYKDMRSEDTGTWGNYADDRRPRSKNDFGMDERFREGGSGANARPLGERKRYGEDVARGADKKPRVDSR